MKINRCCISLLGLTTWLCVAPQMAIVGLIPISLLPIVFYALLDKKPLKNHLTTKTATNKHEKYMYTPLKENSNENIAGPSNKILHNALIIFKAFPYISYIYIAACSFYLSQAAVLSTLTFPSAPFGPHDHFQYYSLLINVGVLFGGLEYFFVMCICPKWAGNVKIKRVWILVLLHVSHLLFYVFASWYHFLTNISIVLVLCFIHGVVHGCILTQILACVARDFKSANDRGNALWYAEIGLSVGRIGSGLLGLFIEKYLREHCTNRLLLGTFCLARHSSSAGWSINLQCSF